MNRRGFLQRFSLAIAAVAVAPAVNLLAEPETPCGGLIWQIQNSGSTYTYQPLTRQMFDEVLAALDRERAPEQVHFWTTLRGFENLKQAIGRMSK